MSDQTDCVICTNHLRGRGILRSLHALKMQRLNRASDHDEIFSCIRWLQETLQLTFKPLQLNLNKLLWLTMKILPLQTATKL